MCLIYTRPVFPNLFQEKYRKLSARCITTWGSPVEIGGNFAGSVIIILYETLLGVQTTCRCVFIARYERYGCNLSALGLDGGLLRILPA